MSSLLYVLLHYLSNFLVMVYLNTIVFLYRVYNSFSYNIRKGTAGSLERGIVGHADGTFGQTGSSNFYRYLSWLGFLHD